MLEREDEQFLVNKSKDYLKCFFNFKTDDWNNLEKFAIFKNEKDEAYVCNLGDSLQCECTIPEPVLTGTFFRVSVYGGDRITTNEKTVVLVPSGYTTQIKVPGDSVTDVFTEIYALLNEKITGISFTDGIMTIYNENGVVSSFELLEENDLSNVANSGDYNDLINIPQEFPPQSHNHVINDVTDFEENVDVDMGNMLDYLADKISEE